MVECWSSQQDFVAEIGHNEQGDVLNESLLACGQGEVSVGGQLVGDGVLVGGSFGGALNQYRLWEWCDSDLIGGYQGVCCIGADEIRASS